MPAFPQHLALPSPSNADDPRALREWADSFTRTLGNSWQQMVYVLNALSIVDTIANRPATPAIDHIFFTASDTGALYIGENGVWVQLNAAGVAGAPSTATYVTGAADAGLSAELVLGTAVIMRGTLAGRPAASLAGRLYYVNDAGDERWTRDTGATWQDSGPDWDYVTAKPATFPAAAHTHPESDVTSLVADLALKVPTSRLISTTAPVTGGGDLSADRTIAVSAATTTTTGVVELATSGESAANVVVQGNDARMSDARTPLAHTHPESEVTGLVADLAAIVASVTALDNYAGSLLLMGA